MTRALRVTAALALAASLLATQPQLVRALGVAMNGPRAAEGYLWVDLRLADLFPPRVESSLARGMPATLIVHVELWRRRRAWFDALANTYESAIKIRYDVWSGQYRIERPGAPVTALGTIDSVAAYLSRPLALPVARSSTIEPSTRYYLSASVTLKPLTVEDLEEGEGWLSGEVEDKRKSGLGVITGLPVAVFDAVRNFAGFGDQRVRVISDDFGLAELFP